MAPYATQILGGLGAPNSKVEVFDSDKTLRTTAEWLGFKEQADIPSSRVNGMPELPPDFDPEQVGFVQMVDHPAERRIGTMRVPAAWNKAPKSPPYDAQNPGEHGRALLHEVGCTDQEIASWLAECARMLPQENG